MEQLKITPINKFNVKVLNFEDIKLELNNILSAIDLENFESEKARLNKLKKSIEDKRKEIKKEIMSIYDTDFEPQVKELVSLIDNTIDILNKRVEAKKEAYEREKRIIVEEIWEELDFKLIDLDKIFNSKWLNKTYSERQVQDDMISLINKIKEDLIVLESLEDKDALKSKYLINLNLAETIAVYNAEKQAKSRLYQTKDTKEVELPTSIEKLSITLKITGSKEQLRKLNMFLEENFIEWEQINEK